MNHSIEKTGSQSVLQSKQQPIQTPLPIQSEPAQGAGERFAKAMRPGEKKAARPTDETAPDNKTNSPENLTPPGTNTPDIPFMTNPFAHPVSGAQPETKQNPAEKTSEKHSGAHHFPNVAEGEPHPLKQHPQNPDAMQHAPGKTEPIPLLVNAARTHDVINTTRTHDVVNATRTHDVINEARTYNVVATARTDALVTAAHTHGSVTVTPDAGTKNSIDKTSETAKPTPGDSILAALQGTSGMPSPVATLTRTDVIVQTATPQATTFAPVQLAERILSAASTANGPAEVRISLKDTVLPDTEIRIQRTGDQLAVLFVTGSDASEQSLAPHLRDLQTTLSQRFAGDVRVGLERPDMGGNAQGNAQGDGRSRQQRNLFEELAEAQ